MNQYSANEELINLARNLGFRWFIFDDPSLGPEIVLRERSKNADVDGVLLYKNIFCLVSIDRGVREDINKKIKDFEEKLDRINRVEDVDLFLDIKKKMEKNIKPKEEEGKRMLRKIKAHKKRWEYNYDMILKKLFFAPHKEIDNEKIKQYRDKGVIIIDKDIFEYFQEILNRLGKDYLFYDFIYFINIKKTDLNKKGTAKTKIPGKFSSFAADRVELKKENIIMYSLSLRVEDIKDYVTVLRIAQKYNKKGFQRMIKSNRLEKINEEYLSKKYTTFPNNIIIALNPEIYKNENDFYDKENKTISFFDEYNSLVIIDGQHRFFSFIKGKKIDRPILATFIFFRPTKTGKEYTLMERMFYKINKTQERIDPNLSFVIKARIDPESEENFWYQVFKKLDKKGFFQNRFSFKETAIKKPGEPKSIISVITYGGVLKLNKEYKKSGLYVDGLNTFYTDDRENNINFAFNLLNNYFEIIEEILYDQKINKKSLNIREIGALIRLIRHFILTDKEKVRSLGQSIGIVKKDFELKEYFKKFLKLIPFEKVINLEYPASNWAAIEGYMLKQIHNSEPSFGSKNLLSKKGLEIYNGGPHN
jgi:DGQHR domain-containing protein